MKTRYITALAVAALIAGGNAAVAQGTGHGKDGKASPQGMVGQSGQMGSQGMMGRSGMGSGGMMQMHQQMMGMHKGMMQGGGMMGGGMGPMMEALDADGDGTVTPEEAHGGLQALVAEYDANGDETLSIAEFETLHSALIRETMVDRFQFLDDDGDGQVTTGEIVKPADMMARMQSMRERMMQGGGMGPGTGMGQQDEPGRSVMDNN